MESKHVTGISLRMTAAAVGILYIIGTVAGVLSVLCTNEVLQQRDLLQAVSHNRGALTGGALLVLLMGFSLALIPILLYPILRQKHPALAVGYVVFRGALETTTYLLVAAAYLALLPLGAAVSADAANFGSLAGAAAALRALGDSPLTVFVFSIGALLFYTALYRSCLIPRWISVWGIAAILLHLCMGFFELFGNLSSFSPLSLVLNFPIFLQELVLAVYLIAKGFHLPNYEGKDTKQ